VATEILQGMIAVNNVDASAILDGDEASATADVQQSIALVINTDVNGNITSGYLLANTSQCDVYAYLSRTPEKLTDLTMRELLH
jgi:hypothetical protein